MKATKLKRVVLKEEFVAITESLEGALILAQMCYWSERIYDIDQFLEEECREYAESNSLKHHGWIRKSAKQLAEDMNWAMCGRTIQRHFEHLVNLKFLDKRTNPNPAYKFDRSYQYRVNFCEIQKALKSKGYRLSGYKVTECFDTQDCETQPIAKSDECIGQIVQSSGQNDQSNGQNDQTIIETNNINHNRDNKENHPTGFPQGGKTDSVGKKTKFSKDTRTTEEFVEYLKETYDWVDVDRELKKIDAWLEKPVNKGKRHKTRRFVEAWIARSEKPMEKETYKGNALGIYTGPHRSCL